MLGRHDEIGGLNDGVVIHLIVVNQHAARGLHMRHHVSVERPHLAADFVRRNGLVTQQERRLFRAVEQFHQASPVPRHDLLRGIPTGLLEISQGLVCQWRARDFGAVETGKRAHTISPGGASLAQQHLLAVAIGQGLLGHIFRIVLGREIQRDAAVRPPHAQGSVVEIERIALQGAHVVDRQGQASEESGILEQGLLASVEHHLGQVQSLGGQGFQRLDVILV